METPTLGSEDGQFLAGQAHRLPHDEAVAEGMNHFSRWQEDGGERRLAAYLYRLSDRHFSRDTLEELVRETVSRVLGAILRGQYAKRENAAFSTYVFTVARNLYINEGRRRANQSMSLELLSEKGHELPDPLDALEAQIEAAEWRHLLNEGLAALKPLEHYVVIAHYVDKRPFPEIAKELGKSPAAVRKTASRAMAKLKVLVGSSK